MITFFEVMTDHVELAEVESRDYDEYDPVAPPAMLKARTA